MEITETTRHAVAITEAVCADLLPSFKGISFDVKPVTDVLYGQQQISDVYNTDFRVFDIKIKNRGKLVAVLDLVLMRDGLSQTWQTAIVEFRFTGGFTASYNFRAGYTEGRWALRKMRRFAYGAGNILKWDATWRFTSRSFQTTTP